MTLRGYYKVASGNVSARHPFHGDYYAQPDMYDEDISAQDYLYKGVRGVDGLGLEAAEIWDMSKQPLLRGLFVGATAWMIARAVGADKKVAHRVGFVSGGVEAIMSMGAGWLSDQINAQLDAQQQVATAPAPTPAAGLVTVPEQ